MTLDSKAKKAVSEFTKSLEEGQRSVLLLCEDSWRRAEAEKLLLKGIFGKEQPAPYYADGASLNQQEIVVIKDKLHEPSLFAPVQAVLIRNADKIKSQQTDSLKKLLKDLPQGSLLLLSTPKLPARNALRTALKKQNGIVDIPELKSADFERWVKSQLKKQGLGEYPTTLPGILEDVSHSECTTCLSHIERLSLFANNGCLTDSEMSKMLTQLPEAGEFPLIDAIFAGKSIEAERQLSHLLAQGKSPFIVLSLISRSVTQHLQLSECLRQKVPEGQIAARIGMKPWLQKRLMSNLKRIQMDKLLDAPAAILKADSQLKNKSLGADYILEELVHNLSR